MTEEKLEVGDFVRNIHGIEGQIVEEFNNYWHIADGKENFISMTPDSWLEQQLIPFTQKQINEERWFSIHCPEGGGIWCCESQLEFIERPNIENLINPTP